MQTFGAFHSVYCFFVRCALEPKYVQTIDEMLNSNTASKEVKQMIQRVKAFHNMRATLCTMISDHINQSKILTLLATAHGIEQYNSVPDQSKCAISKQVLRPKQNNHRMFAVI